MGIEYANIPDMWEKGRAASQEDRKRQALQQFLAPALKGDQSAFDGLVHAGAGNEALAAQQHYASMQKSQQDALAAKHEQMGKVASAFAATKSPALWAQLHSMATELMPQAEGMPADLDTPEHQQGAVQFATALGQAYGGAKAPEPYSLHEGEHRFDANNHEVASVDAGPPKPIWDSERGVFVQPPTAGSAAPTPSQGPTGGASSLFNDAYSRVPPAIRATIEAAAAHHGIPPAELLAVASRETGFNPNAVNKQTGAAGLFQYTPSTAAMHHIDPYNTQQAAEQAATDWASRRAVGGVAEAAASHFAGPGGGNRGPKTAAYVADVQRRIAQFGGTPPQATPQGGPQVIPVPGLGPKPARPMSEAERLAAANAAARLDLAKTASVRADKALALQGQAQRSKPMSGDVANKVGLYDNALTAAQKWAKVVIGKDGSFNDIAAMTPGARALLNEAVRAKLRAESGAAISEPELDGEVSRYMGGLMSSDATNVEKARTLINDVQHQRDVLVQGRAGDAGGAKSIVRTGTHNGRKVVQYSDGTTAYAD